MNRQTIITSPTTTRKRKQVKTTATGRIWRSAAAGVAAIVTALALGIAPATAAPIVDGSKLGSITVHKFERPATPTGLANNGTQVDTSGLTPMKDVEFTINKVDTIDLTTNEGWKSANGLSASFDPANAEDSITGAGFTLGAAKKQATLADGTAAFTDLPLGLYLVTETGYATGVTPSAPFLVTVPLTDPNSTSDWLYDVHVYPKNSITTATKTVNDAADIKLGDTVDFTITADIPNDAVIDGYKITDALDTKLGYVSTAVTLTNGTPLTLTTHYTVNHDVATNTVTVEFTAAGRTLLAANNTTTVQVVVSAAVNAVGEISNTALVFPNQDSFDWVPGQPGGPTTTPPIVTKWGSMTLQKNDQSSNALAGASFSVYATEADALAGTNPITLGGATVFTVDPSGQLTISGLRYSDWANGAAVSPGDPNYRNYYLVETKAPNGYELLAKPVPFTITADTTVAGVDLTVVNVPSNGGFKLPLTGGTGTTILYAAGVLVLAGATLLFVRSRRKQHNA